MTSVKSRILRGACVLAACLAAAGTLAATDESPTSDAGNLIVVLRESRGECQPDETLQPFGKVRATMPDGRKVDIDVGWFHYIGDMHLRLVFD